MYTTENKTNNSSNASTNNALDRWSFFQPKLTINQPDDAYEQEADAVANKIVSADGYSSAQNFFSPAAIQRLSQQNINKEELPASSKTENYVNNLSGGKPLNPAEKNFFEARMGYDFSNVHIHTDSTANASAKDLKSLAYTSGNNIVFGSGKYEPYTEEGRKLLAHELTHVVQQSGANSKQIQSKAELDKGTQKDEYTKCLVAIENVIKKLEANASKEGMPDDIKEAIKLLRKKYTENKIKCYYLDGNDHGITNFATGEIYMDAKLLKDTTDVYANIGEGNLLHEGIHALHNEKYPTSTKKYGKALEDQEAGKNVNLSGTELKEIQKLKAWTEYWAYRKMREYNNITYSQGKDDETIHNETLKRMKEEGGIAALNTVWAFDPKWDPRKWKPKN